MTVTERLRDKANSLPQTPGVYIMKDADGNIIYVGKSKKLKNRVSSYFSGTHASPKTVRLVSLIRDFDYILCKTEIEALTLENVLIKKHSPKYNIKLKDAKSYPYIKMTGGEYPKLIVTRDRRGDGGKYFGPYQGVSLAYAALETVLKAFCLPTCKRKFPEDIKKERPCIYRDMGRCVAPCTGEVSPEDYGYLIKCAERVLLGDIKETKEELTAIMLRYAEAEEFEKAASVRDKIAAISALTERQKVVADEKINRDVFAFHISETEGVMATLTIRAGALINKSEFMLSRAEGLSSSDAVSLIADYYESSTNLPREVLLDFRPEEDDLALLSDYLSLLANRRIAVRCAERGDGRALCEMARKNAEEVARQYRLEGQREDKNLKRLATLLGLPYTPRRIEAYDISNFGDECIRASMIVYEDGKLKRSDYRSFKINTTDGRDDYGSMKEALRRRLNHIGDSSPSLGVSPDLILLDGGDGHVNSVKPILSELGLDVPVFGMVKDDFHKTRAITDGEREISIAQELGAYAFVYNLQEEAHRFAYGKTSSAKIKAMRHSTLEAIKGIGAAKAKRLLAEMSLAEIKKASLEELMKIRGISKRDAEAIYSHYNNKE